MSTHQCAIEAGAKAGDMLSFASATDKDEIELSGEQLHALIEAARQFVKEHGK